MAAKLSSTSARAELASLTRERIMRAIAAAIIAEEDVTFHALAKASGIPERTIYRYFPAREELLSAFWTWLNERLGMPAPPKSPDELVAQVPALFAAFETDEALVRAMLHDRQGRATRLSKRAARRAKLEAALDDVLQKLDADGRRRLVASVQALYSAAGWETMKDYCGISSAAAADAAQWAIATLIGAARQSRTVRRGSANGEALSVSRKSKTR